MHVEEAYATLHFCIILISLRVEMAQISDFLVNAKILPLWKACFNLNLPHSTLGKKNIALYFFLYLTSHSLFWSSSISTRGWVDNARLEAKDNPSEERCSQAKDRNVRDQSQGLRTQAASALKKTHTKKKS